MMSLILVYSSNPPVSDLPWGGGSLLILSSEGLLIDSYLIYIIDCLIYNNKI